MGGYGFGDRKKPGERLDRVVMMASMASSTRTLSGSIRFAVQAKRYAEGSNIGAGAMRDFFRETRKLEEGTQGIFVTTSDFSASAIQTAR